MERNPTDQNVGNVNFLPGMGAFLQSVIYGFAGFRIRPDKLEIHNPTPPPGTNQIKLINFYYLGSNMTFTVMADTTTIQVLRTNPAQPLILRRNATGAVEESLTSGMIYFGLLQLLLIIRQLFTRCRNMSESLKLHVHMCHERRHDLLSPAAGDLCCSIGLFRVLKLLERK